MTGQQQFDASGFDDDLEDIATQVKAEDSGAGFNHHPRGKFQGIIEEVVSKAWQGQQMWVLRVGTSEGVAESTLWGWKPGEVAAAKAKAASGNVEDLQRVQATMARHKRLFVDVGLPEPETWAKGDNSIVGRIPELQGKRCTVVVQADKKNPTRDRVFINAPAPDHGGDHLSDPTAGPGLEAPDFAASGPGLNDMPFMRKEDF